MVSGSSASNGVARRGNYFLSHGHRLASEREERIRRRATQRVGNNSTKSRDCQWLLRRGGEPRRARSAGRRRRNRILGTKLHLRAGRRDHRQRFDRKRRNCDWRSGLGASERISDALAIFARPPRGRLLGNRATSARLRVSFSKEEPYVCAMKTILFLTMLCAVACFAQAQEVSKAAAQLEPKSNSKVTGTVTFTKVGDEVQVLADIQNLTPGKHGFHI